MKKLLLIVISISTGIVTLILIIFGKNPLPVIGVVILVYFLICALWNPPKKHKDFSLSDQWHATSRALGGGGVPDLSQLKPKERKSRQRKA